MHPQPETPLEQLAKMQARAEKAEQALATCVPPSQTKARETREQIEHLSRKSLGKSAKRKPEGGTKDFGLEGAKRKKKSRKGRGRLPNISRSADGKPGRWAAVAGVGLVGAAAPAREETSGAVRGGEGFRQREAGADEPSSGPRQSERWRWPATA